MGGLVKKPHESCCRATWGVWAWLQKFIELVITSSGARFGDGTIGMGHSGIRFTANGGAGIQHARMAVRAAETAQVKQFICDSYVEKTVAPKGF
jgi:hypothetical protein